MYFLSPLDRFFLRAVTHHIPCEAGSADCPDIGWTQITGGAAGKLTDAFHLEGLTVTLIADPTPLQQIPLSNLRDLQLL